MHIKWLPHGVGDATRATAYVLADRDHLGRTRTGVRVLRGNPEVVAQVANSLAFKYRYSSGVIAWSPDDAPTSEQVDEVLNRLDELMFAGLDGDRGCWTAVEHIEDDGSMHLHVLVARVDLRSGRSFNPAPPGWQESFDALRDSFNWTYGWARPDDPARARLVQPGHQAFLDAQALRQGLAKAATAKEQITDWLMQKVKDGSVTNRAGVRQALAEIGEITREGKDHISVKPAGYDKALRLKGGLYGEDFDAADLIGHSDDRKASPDNRAIDSVAAAAAREELEKAIARRSAYNRERYHIARDRYHGTAESAEVASDVGPDEHAGLAHSEIRRGHSIEVFLSQLRRSYDRARAIVVDHARACLDRIQNAFGGTRRCDHVLVAASAGLVLSGRTLERAAQAAERRGSGSQEAVTRGLVQGLHALEQTAERACGVLKMRRADEIERFKRDINLVEYAEACGFEIDRRESSRASLVMRQGDDKIIVATDQDGHGVYFNVRDESDNGTIIDFVQKRHGLNLGQVRKELRPWIGGDELRYSPPRRKPEAERPHKPAPSSPDRQVVLAAWARIQPTIGRHPYLEQVRKLAPATLADPRFVDMVRSDERGNAAFPHFDQQGLTGYELKNDGFTGFSPKGTKAVWASANLEKAPRVILVESAIDAMSHAQLSGDVEAAYLSIGGTMSDDQRALVRAILAKAAEREAEVIIATDADEPGRKLAAELQTLAPAGANVARQEPTQGKDWNDQVKVYDGDRERSDTAIPLQ